MQLACAFVLNLSLLLACGPKRFATHTAYLAPAREWVKKNGIANANLDTLVDGTRVLALGDAAHGARDVFVARAELTRRMIEDGWAKALVLEADVWSVCSLEQYINGDSEDVRYALGPLPGIYGHDDSAIFFQWLRAYNQNRGLAEKVHVHGMDAQSMEVCSANHEENICPDRLTLCEQATSLRQAPDLGETYFGRDEIMARNVLRIVQKSVGGVIVWAHSGHVSRSPPLLFNGLRRSTAPMGWFIAQALGSGYRSMTVTFRRGTIAVQSLVGGMLTVRFGAVTPVRLPDAPPETLEGLVSPDTGAIFINLRNLSGFDGPTAWFASPQFTRSIGGAERVRQLRKSFLAKGWGKYVVREAFDYAFILPNTSPLQYWFAAGKDRRVRPADGAYVIP